MVRRAILLVQMFKNVLKDWDRVDKMFWKAAPTCPPTPQKLQCEASHKVSEAGCHSDLAAFNSRDYLEM